MKGLFFVLGIWLFVNCSRDADPQPTIQGTYRGNFQRGNNKVSRVQLTFTGNRYTGEVVSTERVYPDATVPVICTGSFVVDQQTIDFQDECVYTANFDWTLILSQKWTFSTSANSLILSRNNDRYVLTKE